LAISSLAQIHGHPAPSIALQNISSSVRRSINCTCCRRTCCCCRCDVAAVDVAAGVAGVADVATVIQL